MWESVGVTWHPGTRRTPPSPSNDADEEIHNLEKLLITITIRGVVENSQLFRVYSPTATTTARAYVCVCAGVCVAFSCRGSLCLLDGKGDWIESFAGIIRMGLLRLFGSCAMVASKQTSCNCSAATTS